MKRLSLSVLAIFIFLTSTAGAAEAMELRGSPASMKRQHGIAVENGYAFVETVAQMRDFVDEGRLVELAGNADYDVTRVRYSYSLPELRTLIERLSAQYRERTAERLVVTSLTRPTTGQPANAHALSVHPAGMAVDLRVPKTGASRKWLERTLLSLEDAGLLDVTREYYPPHYHVAVYPQAYMAYVEERRADEAAAKAAEPPTGTASAPARTSEPAAASPEPAPARFRSVSALLLAMPITAIALSRLWRTIGGQWGGRLTRVSRPWRAGTSTHGRHCSVARLQQWKILARRSPGRHSAPKGPEK